MIELMWKKRQFFILVVKNALSKLFSKVGPRLLDRFGIISKSKCMNHGWTCFEILEFIFIFFFEVRETAEEIF